MYEGDETFSVEISLPTDLEIGRGVARGTIVDDDLPPSVAFLFGHNVRLSETRQGFYEVEMSIGTIGETGCPSSDVFRSEPELFRHGEGTA